MVARAASALASVLPVAVLLGPSHAVERCEHPTGGVLDMGCTPGTDVCPHWVNATCNEKRQCECRPGQCIIKGQCVDKGESQWQTGGKCRFLNCDPWRNASCSERVPGRENKCICLPGTRPVGDGECRPPGVCAKWTGATCNWWRCPTWSRATCSGPLPLVDGVDLKCMCGEGTCPMAGECVKEGDCPRYTQRGCGPLNFYPSCTVGTCDWDENCRCIAGECYLDGQCVPANRSIIQLSRALAVAQDEARRPSVLHPVFAVPAGLACSATAARLTYGRAPSGRATPGPASRPLLLSV